MQQAAAEKEYKKQAASAAFCFLGEMISPKPPHSRTVRSADSAGYE